jgi:hypothetical protein
MDCFLCVCYTSLHFFCATYLFNILCVLHWCLHNFLHVQKRCLLVCVQSMFVFCEEYLPKHVNLLLVLVLIYVFYHVVTLTLGLWPKQRGLQGCRPKGSLGVTTTCSWKCRKVWGNESSHSQGNSHFGKWNPVAFWIFRRRLQGSKLNGLRSYIYHWKDLGM